MKRAAIAFLSLSLLPLAAGDARAQSQASPRARIFLNGAFDASAIDFSEARKYTLFVEESTLDASYKAKTAPGFDAGLQVRVFRKLGVSVAFSSVKRDETASVKTGLPHPFFFDQKRQVEGDAKGYKHKESVFHFDLAYSRRSGSIEYAFFAGASRFKVETDIVDHVEFSQTYPFDTATLTGLPGKTLEDRPTGFNVGGSFDYHLGQYLGLGGQVRFSRAKAKPKASDDSTLEINVGGLQAAAGVRIYF